MKPNVVSLDNPELRPTRDLPGYGVNLAMSFAEECLSRWGRAKTGQQRETWSKALPIPLEMPWPEDSNEVIEAARTREPYKEERGYKPDDFDRDLDQALKAGSLPAGSSIRPIGAALMSSLPESTEAILSGEARKAGYEPTDGYTLEWLLGATATAWGLTRTKLGGGKATIPNGYETLTGDGWTVRLESSGDYGLHVSWWLSWGVGHPAHALAWEGANLEWLGASAPTEQLTNLITDLNKRRLTWLVQANRVYVRVQLAPLVHEYADTSTPRKYRYVALFSQTDEQRRRTPKTASVVAAIQRVTLNELTDRRLPAEIPEGVSPASVAVSGGGCLLPAITAIPLVMAAIQPLSKIGGKKSP